LPGKSYVDDFANPDNVEVLSGTQFEAMFKGAHRQGEHISIVGPTGSGKTRLGLTLCKWIGSRMGKDKRPSRVTVLCYKPRDDTMRDILPEKQWPEIKRWPPAYGQEHCIVWVRKGGNAQQRAVFVPLLDRVYQEGGQTVYVPEAAHFERKPPDGLGMGGKMTEFWSAARSNKTTMVSDTQRPRYVTRSMWTEPEWVIIFTPEDEDDLREVAKLSGKKVAVLSIVGNLGPYEFLCIRRQRGQDGQRALYISKLDS
jgi:energy-coupling factor transporter ATP-binding protein EcfA2